MKRYLPALLLVVAGVAIGFPLFSMTYYTMVRTSTPGFCASCHEIRPAVTAWRASSHANNAQGFVADCMDCHLPAPHDTVDFFFAKTFHGLKDVWAHFFKGPYDREHNRQKAYAAFKNEQCQKCHRNILHIPNKRGAMLAHRTVLFARPGYARQCVDCHYDLVHNDYASMMYQHYRRLPYQAKGLRLAALPAP
jgi:cytochrome c-type protein NapC/trimethylamine-N-oxide reductase cytochrome c-type subunit TorC